MRPPDMRPPDVRAMIGLLALATSLALALPFAGTARAQVPPSEAEVRAYAGLHAAAARGDAAEIETLVKTGARIDAQDSRSRTPLHVAVFFRRHDAARTLIRLKANVNALEQQQYDAITIASVNDDVEMLKLVIAGGGNARAITSPYRGTALIAAAHLGHAEVVRTLIAAKAPLDHVNNLGWTALIESIVLGNGGKNHTDTLEALVKAGADVNLADRNGSTPLQLARGRGYGDMVKLLEAANAR